MDNTIITILGFIGAMIPVVTVILKLNSTITKLNITIEVLNGQIKIAKAIEKKYMLN